MDKIEIRINDIPPSNNQYMGKQRNYHVYQQEKKRWKLLVREALSDSIPATPYERVKVKLHYIFPNRRRHDVDNYSGKFLLDALVEYGVIKDDNYTVLESLELSGEYKKGIKQTVIDIEGMDEKFDSRKEKIPEKL